MVLDDGRRLFKVWLPKCPQAISDDCSLVVVVALFAPGVAVHVVAVGLPEAGASESMKRMPRTHLADFQK